MKIVYYDLETTNLRPLTGPSGIEIVQIGAICKHTRSKSQRSFDKYLVPRCSISPGATQVHGLTRQWLVQRWMNAEADVSLLQQGLQEFMNFLDEQKQYPNEEIILVRT